MRHIDVFNTTVGLLVAVALTLTGLPTTAQNLSKGKVSPVLMELTNPALRRLVPAAADSPIQADDQLQVYDGYVVVEAVANEAGAKQLLADLKAKGLRKGAAAGGLVSGLLPISKLAALEKLASLQQLRPAYKPVNNVGITTSQGDRAMRGDVARTRFGLTGQGVKVGILSDSYNNLGGAAAGVASGDLPAGVQVLQDAPSGGLDEGRGMAEIVHDVAPGAALAFHTAFLGQANFAQGISDLQAAGCRVIVDDVVYFAEPFFQDGIIAQAADAATRQGSAYFSSAGNQAQQSYEAPFQNSGTSITGIPGVAHSFATGDIRQSITIGGGRSLRLDLQWADPAFSASGLRGAQTDLDIYVLFNGNIVTRSTANNIGGDPFEFVGVSNQGAAPATVEIVIVKYAGPDPTLIKYINFGSRPTAQEYGMQASTLFGHANTERAVAVAAAPYFNTPAFNVNTPIPVVESFSSLGGTPLLFDTRGRRLNRAKLAQKPEITGPDGGNTTFFPPFPGADYEGDGFPNFFGTSAAAPHVAAVAALMLQATQGDIEPQGITVQLQKSAIDMDNPLTTGFDQGFDVKTGYGFVQAEAALARVIDDNDKGKGNGEDRVTTLSSFPNPSSDKVNFRVAAAAQQAVILTVVDRMGREVFRAQGTGQLAVAKNFDGLPKGLYVAKTQTSTGVKTQLIMIE